MEFKAKHPLTGEGRQPHCLTCRSYFIESSFFLKLGRCVGEAPLLKGFW